MRNVIVYIAASLDGYIAGPGDDLAFLSLVQEEGEDYGYAHFMQQIDTVIMGRKTYDWVMGQVPEFPHADKEAYIITRTPRPTIGHTQFYTGNVGTLLRDLKQVKGKDIFIDGGAQVIDTLLQEDLIDEIYLSIIPVLLGSGVRLFQQESQQKRLQLVTTQSFKTGLVQLQYKRLR